VQGYFARIEQLEQEVEALKARVSQLEAAAGSSGTHTSAAAGSAPGSANAESGQDAVARNDDNIATTTPLVVADPTGESEVEAAETPQLAAAHEPPISDPPTTTSRQSNSPPRAPNSD
jgi:hypothetical protein